MSKQITTTVYQFDELSDKAKEKARDWWRNGDIDFDWADNMIEDAKMIGLEITGFDVGRGQSCDGKFIDGARECAEAILKNHGDQCETFKTAEAFLKERDEAVNAAPKDENGDFENEYELDGTLDDIESDFLKSILEDYRILLAKEFEYHQSNEYIDEMLRIYTFTKDGKRFGN